MPILSHYELLGLPSTATTEEISQRVKTLSLLWHPDKCDAWISDSRNKTDAVEIYQRILTARDILTKESSRLQYNAMFKPMPTTISEELFRRNWERLNPQCIAYSQRNTTLEQSVAFLHSQVKEVQDRHHETSHQLGLLGRHFTQVMTLLQERAHKMEEQTQAMHGLLRKTAESEREMAALRQRNAALEQEAAALTQRNAALQQKLALQEVTIAKNNKPDRMEVEQRTHVMEVERTHVAAAAALKVGQFADRKRKAPDKLKLDAEDGLIAIVKVINVTVLNNTPEWEWYWVRLKFKNAEKATAFKERYTAIVQNDWPLRILLSDKIGSESILEVTLKNSPEYRETFDCQEKIGMIILRELAKYIDIAEVEEYFFNSKDREIIADHHLPQQFKDKFLNFDLSNSAKADANEEKMHVDSPKVGQFSRKSPDKLVADGLIAIIKVIQVMTGLNNAPEWAWDGVRLEFKNSESAETFKKEYTAIVQDDWPLTILFSMQRNGDCILEVSLKKHSAEYYETGCCDENIARYDEKTGMIIMRELARYIKIAEVKEYFFNADTGARVPNILPPNFERKLIIFNCSNFAKADVNEEVHANSPRM